MINLCIYLFYLLIHLFLNLIILIHDFFHVFRAHADNVKITHGIHQFQVLQIISGVKSEHFLKPAGVPQLDNCRFLSFTTRGNRQIIIADKYILRSSVLLHKSQTGTQLPPGRQCFKIITKVDAFVPSFSSFLIHRP